MHPDGDGPPSPRGRGQLRHALCHNLFADPTDPRTNANDGVHYQLITPLFTDYAEKYRFIFHTGGQTGGLQQQEYPGFRWAPSSPRPSPCPRLPQ